MAEKSPAFQFYPKDLLSDGKAMAMPFHVLGIYWKLLCHDWIDDGLPDDDDELLAIAGYYPSGKVEKRNIIKRLREKFVNHPTKQEFITNPRLLKEREKQLNNSKNKSEAGKKGAEKRWQTHDSANSKPVTENSSSSSTSSSSSKNNKDGISKKPEPRILSNPDEQILQLAADFENNNTPLKNLLARAEDMLEYKMTPDRRKSLQDILDDIAEKEASHDNG